MRLWTLKDLWKFFAPHFYSEINLSSYRRIFKTFSFNLRARSKKSLARKKLFSNSQSFFPADPHFSLLFVLSMPERNLRSFFTCFNNSQTPHTKIRREVNREVYLKNCALNLSKESTEEFEENSTECGAVIVDEVINCGMFYWLIYHRETENEA